MASRRRRRTPSSELVDDDAMTEVLLRLPPQEPAYLVRASLVCMQWRRVLSDPAFHRLYASFHRRTPPLLGFFNTSQLYSRTGGRTPCFVQTTAAASPFSSVAAADHCPWLVLDCRHGRVLLQRRHIQHDDDNALGCCLVWDAITGDRHELRWPNNNNIPPRSATVLCAAAAAGCDHSGCRGGPFLVLCACVGVHSTGWHAYAYVYSSQLRAWGAPAQLDLHDYQHVVQSRAVVIGDQVYFFRFLMGNGQILKYDLRKQCLSVIESPDLSGMDIEVQLMTTEDGSSLGIASVRGSKLYLWSSTANAEAEEGVVVR